MWGHWASGQGPHHSSQPGRHSSATEAVLFWREHTVRISASWWAFRSRRRARTSRRCRRSRSEGACAPTRGTQPTPVRPLAASRSVKRASAFPNTQTFRSTRRRKSPTWVQFESVTPSSACRGWDEVPSRRTNIRSHARRAISHITVREGDAVRRGAGGAGRSTAAGIRDPSPRRRGRWAKARLRRFLYGTKCLCLGETDTPWFSWRGPYRRRVALQAAGANATALNHSTEQTMGLALQSVTMAKCHRPVRRHHA